MQLCLSRYFYVNNNIIIRRVLSKINTNVLSTLPYTSWLDFVIKKSFFCDHRFSIIPHNYSLLFIFVNYFRAITFPLPWLIKRDPEALIFSLRAFIWEFAVSRFIIVLGLIAIICLCCSLSRVLLIPLLLCLSTSIQVTGNNRRSLHNRIYVG